MKINTVPILLIFALALTGCSNTTTPTTKTVADNQPKQEQPPVKKSKYPFPKDAKETGKGKFTSEKILYLSKDTIATQLGYETEGFDDSILTFFYINEKFIKSEQNGDSQSTVDIQNENLKPGTYTLSAIQFENNDPIKGKVIEFHQATYKIEPTK